MRHCPFVPLSHANTPRSKVKSPPLAVAGVGWGLSEKLGKLVIDDIAKSSESECQPGSDVMITTFVVT